MPSPTCTVNSTATTDGVNVTAAAGITIALADSAGVSNWSLECIGTDDTTTAAAVNAGMLVVQQTKTATIAAGLAVGQAAIFRSRVNNGRDVNGTLQPSYMTTFGVYCLTSGQYRVVAANETTEGSASFGWAKSYNAHLRAARHGVGAIVMSDANYTATEVQYAKRVLRVTGTFTAARDLILPLTLGDGWWLIENATSGGFNLNVKGATGTAAVIGGGLGVVYTDGTNFY